MESNVSASRNESWQSAEAEDDGVLPVYVRSGVVVVVSVLIISSNLLNLCVLRVTHQIPAISRMCLLNLSCADLAVGALVCAPSMYPAVTGSWPYGRYGCQISGILHGTAATVSIWSLAMVSMDRYVAILHPLRYSALVTPRKCMGVIVATWVLGVATFAGPVLANAPEFVYYSYVPHESMCAMSWTDRWFGIATALYVPVLSGAVMMFSTAMICRAVHQMRHTAPYRHGQRPGSQLRESSFVSSCTGPVPVVSSQHKSDRRTSGCRSAWASEGSESSVTAGPVRYPAPWATPSPPPAIQTIQVDIHEAGAHTHHPVTAAPRPLPPIQSSKPPASEILRRMWRADAIAPEPISHSEPIDKPRPADPDLIQVQSYTSGDEPEPATPPVDLTAQTDGSLNYYKVVKVLGATTVVYLITWAPYVVSHLTVAIWPGSELNPTLQFVFMWLANSNSFMNVLIYSAMYSAIRRNAVTMLRKLCNLHVAVSPIL